MLRVYVRIVALLAALPLFVALSLMQSGRAQDGGLYTYAITNAKIVTVSGPVIERGTIVVRDGLISAVGANVNAPADARIIDGTGLTVYPGLIDSYTNLGIAPPPAAPSPSPGGGFGQTIARPTATIAGGSNSSQPVGLQPEVMADELIRAGGNEIESARNVGITTALSAPRSGIWMGQSALIDLSGDTPQQMIVRSPIAMHVGFTPLRGGTYPGSLMGVFASLRQMLLDAQRYRDSIQTYERSPRGVRRPAFDKSLAALIPVVDGRMPVVMQADREREIERALDLADEFKLKVIITGGLESWKVAERLHQRDVPVLLSLNLPRRTTTALPEADPEPLRVLRERVEAQQTAAKLAGAKVRFAFQSAGLTNISDFLVNAGREIENGLGHDDALRAMTLWPASIFGVADQLGSIEPGKIANLTIMRGDLFDRSSRVAHLIIDGREIEVKATPARPEGGGGSIPPTTAAETTAALAGTWQVNISFEGQNLPGTLVMNHQGASLAGSLQTDMGSAEFTGGSASPEGFRINANANIHGQSMALTIEGKVSGSDISGTITGPMGTAMFSGSRVP